MGRADLRADFETRLLEDVRPEEVEATQYRWEALGFVPPGLDILAIYLDVLSEEVLGFYDPKRGTLQVVVSDRPWGPLDVLTLSHEVTHGLQDQHYDLRAGQEARRGENDQELAYQALVEGDAVLAMLQYALSHLSRGEIEELLRSLASGSSPALDSAPRIMQRELRFPYEEGLEFVSRAFGRGSWLAVNRLWANPPRSSEQVLHPEKYEADEEPILVAAPDVAAALGPGWRELEENTIGELGWQVLVEQWVDRRAALRAAAGWGGDRFRLIRNDEREVLIFVARTVWDSESDAREFFEAYQAVARGRHADDLDVDADLALPLGPQGTPIPSRVWAAGGSLWDHALAIQGTEVTLVVSNDAVAARIATTLLAP